MFSYDHENLQWTLERASELARLSQIISRLRTSEDLNVNECNWFAEYLHPWYLMLGRRQNVINTLHENPLWDLLTSDGYLTANKDRLDALCLQLDDRELDQASRQYMLELATYFRHEYLWQRP